MSSIKVPEAVRMLQNSVLTHDGMSTVIPLNVLYRLQLIAVTGENIAIALQNALRASEERVKTLEAEIATLKGVPNTEPPKEPTILMQAERKKH